MYKRNMDRFIRSVNNMNSTVLVPSKLRDMDVVSDKTCRSVPPCLVNADLYTFYNMLNEVKQDLMCDLSSISSLNCLTNSSSDSHSLRDSKLLSNGVNSASSNSPIGPLSRTGKHTRQPSDDSLGSLGSAIFSDPETDSETDSLLERESSSGEQTAHLAASFKTHLQALHTILQQFADAADFLSARYQEDLDSSL
ncbi:uncharacterized protein LOC141855331 [Brevipalpus obovatus]|uniref:uncharacterized protein LOC141855331 n=1 Tax=Brevipalpus obovatus TaxID=246614 RepID=UPI003D9F3980